MRQLGFISPTLKAFILNSNNTQIAWFLFAIRCEIIIVHIIFPCFAYMMTDRSHITDVQIRSLLIHTVLSVELRTVALFVPYCLSSESYVQNWPNLVILRFSTLSLMIGTVVFEWYKDADAAAHEQLIFVCPRLKLDGWGCSCLFTLAAASVIFTKWTPNPFLFT